MPTPNILLVTERDYLPVLSQLLAHAKKSIDLLAFSFAIGNPGGGLNRRSSPFKVAELLGKAQARGVAVRVLLEGRRETEARNRVTGSFLAKKGIEVSYGSTHAKGVAIDGRYLLLGSTNLTEQSIAKNNETNVVIDDKRIAAGFRRYFEYRAKDRAHGELKLAHPLLADGAFKAEMVKLIIGAKKELHFSIYFFDQADIEAALVAAHERGVAITGFVHQHKTFALPFVRRTRATVKRLRSAGLDGLHFAPPHLFTHSKYLIRDRAELMIGTGNWLDQDVTTHPQLYLRLKKKALAGELAAHLEEMIGEQSTED